MMNQGDYPRTVGFMLGAPLDVVPYTLRQACAFHWAYLKSVASPLTENNSAAIYFWLAGKLQNLVEPDFDLYLVALLSKCIVLLCCFRVATQYFVGRAPFAGAPFVTFTGLALAFFYAHNISFLNSLYPEHAFLIGVAVLLTGHFEGVRGVRIVLIAVGLLMAAASKPQYFYMPLLLGACYLTAVAISHRKADRILIVVLVIVQAVTVLPLLRASTKQVNYYHSLYFGSYDLLTPAQLRQLGVPRPSMGCVGIDWWNWRIVDRDPTEVAPDPARSGCQVSIQTLAARDVLKPYVKHPLLLFRLAAWALPKHFTVHYFEVLPNNFYLRPSSGESYRNGSVLLVASNMRERIITPLWCLFVILGIVVALVPCSATVPVRTLLLFLALSVPAQIAMCLVGEGIRDLSRHLAGAQLSLDVLSVISLVELCAIFLRIQRKYELTVGGANDSLSFSGKRTA